jgi:hypothetical protein
MTQQETEKRRRKGVQLDESSARLDHDGVSSTSAVEDLGDAAGKQEEVHLRRKSTRRVGRWNFPLIRYVEEN